MNQNILYMLYVTVRHWHEKMQNLGFMFLKPKDLENMRVNGLISVVANTRLGIIP